MANKDEPLPGPSGMSGSRKRKWWEDKKKLTDEELEKILQESESDIEPLDSDFDFHPSDLSEDESSEHEDDDELEMEQQPATPEPEHRPTRRKTLLESGYVEWSDNSDSIRNFPFRRNEELLIPPPENEPISYFRHILTDSFIEKVVEETNVYAVEVFLSEKTKEKSRVIAWKETTSDELLIFLGLLLHMGHIRLNRLQDYWKKDPLFNIPVFSQNMSRNRFLLILRLLHFERNPEEGEPAPDDRLYKVRGIIHLFNERMNEIYYPGRELSLDESMVLWRGRLTFRQYIKNKKHKYGIKLYMLTNPTGIILKFMVYTGMLDDSGGKGHADKVVLKLLEEKLNVGHSVFMDNYYNSYALARKLSQNETHTTGTLRIDRRNSPTDVKQKKLMKGETIAKYANGVMIGKWKDKREVCYISNEYKNEMVDSANKRGQIRQKPLPIVQYNKFMSGIDRQDQMLAYYPSERKTIRWPLKIFIHILQMIMINAHSLYNKYSGKRANLYDFRLAVIRKLLWQQPERKPAGKLTHRLTTRKEKTASGKIMRKYCKDCHSRGKRKDTIYVCDSCPNAPGYCLDCAVITHKL